MKFCALLIVSILIGIVSTRGEDKNNCDPSLCSRIRCYSVTPEACDPNSEIYVKRDGVCFCCDTCIPRDEGIV